MPKRPVLIREQSDTLYRERRGTYIRPWFTAGAHGGAVVGAVLDDAVGQHDARLIALHRAGDRKAFALLYDAYHERLSRFVQRHVREADMVEDITQEAFVRAYVAIDKLRDPTRFYPWLSVIARRLVMDHYRLRVRVTAVADIDPGQTEASDGELLQRLTHADLAAALLRVRPRHRDILRMREVEGLSYERIAERLNVPPTTVPPLLWRARVALRREYLAITQEERSWLVLPGLYMVLDGVRRVRDRVLQVAAYLPDPHALTGSVAAVALVIGGASGLAGAAADLRAGLPDQPRRADSVPPAGLTESSASPGVQDTMAPRGATGVAGLSHVRFEQDIHDGRQHDRDTSPYYVEFADHSIAIDPGYARRAADSSLSGNHEWMHWEGGPCVSVAESCS